MECSKNLNQIMDSITRAFGKYDSTAVIHAKPLAKMLMDKPDEAIDRIVSTYNRGVDDMYTDEEGVNLRGYISALAGGPHEAVPHAIYNAVGTVYPYLNRAQKDRALGKIVRGILDYRNYIEVQDTHTPGIREPLLLADVGIVRALYWPGMYEGESLVKKFSDFNLFKQEIMDQEGFMRKDKVNSDFIVAYSLLRSDFCFFGEEYVKSVNPQFLDRVVQGIVSMRFSDNPSDKNKINERTSRLKELLPESLHKRISTIREAADWPNYQDFR